MFSASKIQKCDSYNPKKLKLFVLSFNYLSFNLNNKNVYIFANSDIYVYMCAQVPVNKNLQYLSLYIRLVSYFNANSYGT